MHDKVLNIIRETLLHENEIEEFSFDFGCSTACFDITQLREDGGYPDHALELCFSGIREFHLSSKPTELRHTDALLGIECNQVADLYRAVVSVGCLGHPPIWVLQLVFADLTYKRDSR
jgi:hypothetical protein